MLRMPGKESGSFKSSLSHFVSSLLPTMFLVCKFHEYKRQQQEQSRRKVTERELSNLNHKIDKLLVRLEEHEPEVANTSDEECVICISAKATMQTFPCGHRVVCRKCFVKTIQVAVSQRLLPLRCVICRAKILRLKQTTHGGIVTGAVLRSKVAAAGHTASAAAGHLSNNPFYISPATSPVSPVTEVFREQRAVWVKNYDAFGYSPTGQSPAQTPQSPDSVSKSDQISGCVLHKHCNKTGLGRPRFSSSRSSPNSSPSASSSALNFSSRASLASSPSDHHSSSPRSAPSSPTTSSASATSSSSNRHQAAALDVISSPTSNATPRRGSAGRTTPNPWQFQFNRKKRHRIAHRRRHGNGGRPNSLLLPIDERDELQELLELGEETSVSSSGVRIAETSLTITKVEKRAELPKGFRSHFAPLADGDEDGTELGEEDEDSSSDESTSGSPSRRTSSSGLIDLSGKATKSGRNSPTASKLSATFKKAKHFMSTGKWSIY